MTVYLLKTEEIEALPREFCERNFPGRLKGSVRALAIGAGAMTVSHANDSYFWVVTNFGEMKLEQGYKTQTMMTLIMGIASIIGIFILNLFF